LERCPDEYVAMASRLAEVAGPILRSHFRSPLPIEDKADLSPVTIADRAAEAAMRALLAESLPDHGILGEEHGASGTDAEHVWVLDPIDGTRSFICGVPVFGTLIALARHGRPICGIIDQPISGERWIGAEGHASRLNGQPVSVRPCAEIGQAYCFATSPEIFGNGAEAAAWERIRHAVKLARYGADCYAYALLASGHVDLVVEAGLKPYDFCALVPVIEGAGGIVTDWQGAPLTLESDGRVVAAGDARVHRQALALLAGA
jgi:inositol-phosphate phosphatase/L-galactose 1-phosphate phosphatase/histidinol-phosphatase